MIVASMRSAIATPKPICWNMIRSPRAKPEHGDDDQRRAGDDARRRADTEGHGVGRVATHVIALADPAEQETW